MNATDKQIKYIECLAIDLALDRKTRNLFAGDVVGRDIRYLDELTVSEASRVIDNFRERVEDERATG